MISVMDSSESRTIAAECWMVSMEDLNFILYHVHFTILSLTLSSLAVVEDGICSSVMSSCIDESSVMVARVIETEQLSESV